MSTVPLFEVPFVQMFAEKRIELTSTAPATVDDIVGYCRQCGAPLAGHPANHERGYGKTWCHEDFTVYHESPLTCLACMEVFNWERYPDLKHRYIEKNMDKLTESWNKKRENTKRKKKDNNDMPFDPDKECGGNRIKPQLTEGHAAKGEVVCVHSGGMMRMSLLRMLVLELPALSPPFGLLIGCGSKKTVKLFFPHIPLNYSHGDVLEIYFADPDRYEYSVIRRSAVLGFLDTILGAHGLTSAGAAATNEVDELMDVAVPPAEGISRQDRVQLWRKAVSAMDKTVDQAVHLWCPERAIVKLCLSGLEKATEPVSDADTENVSERNDEE